VPTDGLASLSKRLRSSASTFHIVSVASEHELEGVRLSPLAVAGAVDAEVFETYLWVRFYHRTFVWDELW